MKVRVFLFVLSCLATLVQAQEQPVEMCGYQTEVNRIVQRNPNFLKLQDAWIQAAMETMQAENNSKRSISADTIYLEIPIVFHVLYNSADTLQNISTALILSQLDELNAGFRLLNADTTRIRSIFKPLAADVKIQFVLATKDPNGLPTTGINRISTTRTTFAMNIFGSYTTNMKYKGAGGADAWNPSRYLNVWICNMEFPNFVSITYGFATPPTGSPNWPASSTKDSTHVESGVVLHYKIVGRNNPLAPPKYVEGKAAIHEVGHYLGLRHVWGDGNATTGCSVDDGIYDTPNAQSQNATCSNQNTCNDGAGDLPDMTENYMDYSLDGCAAMFTKQQAYIMRYVLNNFRTGLPKRNIVYDTAKTNGDQQYLVVMPNPSQSTDVKIEFHGPENQIFNLTIVDFCGKPVLQKDIVANTIYTFADNEFAKANYFVIVRDSQGKIVARQNLLIL